MLFCAWWYYTAPRSGPKHSKTKNFDILITSHHSCNSRKCQRSALYVTGYKRFSFTGFYVANFNCDIYVYSSYICTVNVKSRHVLQYIPRNMHTVFVLLCFVVVIHWLIFPYPSGLLHWHCGNLTIAPVPAKQPWWIWINTSCEFIMNDCITTTKQSTTNPCAYFLGYTVHVCTLAAVVYHPRTFSLFYHSGTQFWY